MDKPMKTSSANMHKKFLRLLGCAVPETGSSVVGITIFTPIVAILLFFVIAAGRTGITESKVTTAAYTAARAATQHRSTDTAIFAAQITAAGSLNDNGQRCKGGSQVLIHELNLHPAGKVKLEVVCEVSFADLVVPGLPGSTVVTAEAVAVVDNYRSNIR